MRRKLILWTTVCFLTWMTLFPNAVVYSTEESRTESNLYHYEYQGEQVETSDHHFTFQWWYKDSPRESIRNRYHATNIFKLVNTINPSNQPAAYCSDFLYSIVSDTKYKRINLEDSTYYNAAAARHIRSIVENGYWHDWTPEDLSEAEAKANNWIETYDPSTFETDAFLPYDAEEEVSRISNLTAAEALMATQLAVWAFANTEGDNWWVKYYESLPTEIEGKYQSQELPDNVKAFRKYLIHQQSLPLAPEDIVFTDQYFITDSVMFTGKVNDAATYNLSLKVKLAAPIDQRDVLTLTAALAEREPVDFALSGDNALIPDENGYYTLPFTDVTNGEANAGIKLVLTGSQYVDSVYFYEAKSGEDNARETSQNLVGKASGMTPVFVESNMSVELGTKAVTLYKYDEARAQREENSTTIIVEGDEHKPLKGAVFDLYGKVDEKEYLVMENLISDVDGKISVSGLPKNYDYYFKEVSAPDGYYIEDEDLIYAVGEDDTIFVPNKSIPLTQTPEQENPKDESLPENSPEDERLPEDSHEDERLPEKPDSEDAPEAEPLPNEDLQIEPPPTEEVPEGEESGKDPLPESEPQLDKESLPESEPQAKALAPETGDNMPLALFAFSIAISTIAAVILKKHYL